MKDQNREFMWEQLLMLLYKDRLKSAFINAQRLY